MKKIIQLNTSYILSMVLLLSSASLICGEKRGCGGANDCSDIGQCFTAATAQNVLYNISVPPDTMGAVGPEQYVYCTNNGVRSFNKNTGQFDGILDSDTSAFFNSDDRPFDTRIRYDRFSLCWFAIAIDSNRTENKNLFIAFGDTRTTNGVITKCTEWKIYTLKESLIPGPDGQLGSENFDIDYPTLGIDQNALYIGSRYRRLDPFDNFLSSIYVVNKSSLFGNDGIEIVGFRNIELIDPEVFPFIPTAADNLSSTDLGFGVIAALNISDGDEEDLFTSLVMYRILNSGFKNGLPPILEGPFVIDVPGYNGGSDESPHKGNLGGTAGLINSGGFRLYNGVLALAPNSDPKDKDFRLYLSQMLTVNKDGIVPADDMGRDRNAIRWYEIKNLSDQPVLEQVGTIFDPAEENPEFYIYPSISVNERGDIVIGCSVSAVDQFINGVVFRRFIDDPTGNPVQDVSGISFPNSLVRKGIRITDSTTSYNFQFDGQRPGQRWGDYSNTSLDPNDNMTMWTIQEFCARTDVWGLQVAELKAPAIVPPFPEACN